MSFPQDPLGLSVELLVDDAWSDITGDVRAEQGITVTRGKTAWGETVDPGTLTMTLDNRNGTYSARNPKSDLFGKIGRNTQARVSAPGEDVHLDLDGTADRIASTPATDALQITGDIDVRAEVELTNWYDMDRDQGIMGRWGGGLGDIWVLWVRQGGIRFSWRDSAGGGWVVYGTIPAAMPARAAVRATVDVDNGAGGVTATLYWSDGLAGEWTRIVAAPLAAAQGLATNTAPLAVAPADTSSLVPAEGRLYALEVRDGIDGTVVASADFTAQSPGATSFTDDAGLDWTVDAGALTDRSTRFHGEINAWPTRWSTGGKDVYVPVQGAGIMRRLGQGASPLDSTLRRRIPSADHLLAYWPMEDGQDTSQAGSGLPGGTPARLTGVTWASDSSLGGSAPLPVLGESASMSAPVPRAATDGWHVECVYKLPALPATLTEILRVRVAGAAFRDAVVSVSTSAIRVAALDGDGNRIAYVDYTEADAIASFAGRWNRLIVTMADVGGGECQLLAWWPDTATNFGWAAYTTLTTGMGRASSIIGNWSSGVSGLTVGHLSAFDVHATWDGSHHTFGTLIYSGADTGFAGETAATRFTRLTGEENIPATLPYGSAGTAAVGPQRPGTVLDLLEEAADADVGVLYEARESIALAYRPRVTLYNQTPTLTLDYATDIAPGLQPTEDDTRTRNDITVSRFVGSSARAVADTGPLSTQAPPDGVGRYTTSLTRNVETDDQLPDLAGWLLHLGTWDEARYPQVTVNLAATPDLIGDATAVDIGDIIVITNPPSWLPPGDIRLMVEGYTETLGAYEWTITFNCVPAGPWDVAVLAADDDDAPRADTDGSELAAGIDADATTISVTVTDGPLWTTDTDEYPMNLRIGGGEVVTATACTGTSSPQSMTVTRGVNGITRAWSAGADVRLAVPAIVGL